MTQILRQAELATKDTLKLLEQRDLREMGLPIGAVKLIMSEISKWTMGYGEGARDNNANVDLTKKVTWIYLLGKVRPLMLY